MAYSLLPETLVSDPKNRVESVINWHTYSLKPSQRMEKTQSPRVNILSTTYLFHLILKTMMSWSESFTIREESERSPVKPTGQEPYEVQKDVKTVVGRLAKKWGSWRLWFTPPTSPREVWLVKRSWLTHRILSKVKTMIDASRSESTLSKFPSKGVLTGV